MKRDETLIVGWREWVSLPELDLPIIKAKMDTGAKTSSLHAANIEVFSRNGSDFVRFEVHPDEDDLSVTRLCEAMVIDKRIVKSTCGEREMRPFIRTMLHLGKRCMEIELNLTNREHMGVPILIGREAMMPDILVNPSKIFMLGKRKTGQSTNINQSI